MLTEFKELTFLDPLHFRNEACDLDIVLVPCYSSSELEGSRTSLPFFSFLPIFFFFLKQASLKNLMGKEHKKIIFLSGTVVWLLTLLLFPGDSYFFMP